LIPVCFALDFILDAVTIGGTLTGNLTTGDDDDTLTETSA